MTTLLSSLSKAFKGDLVVPSDPEYANAIARWATNAIRKANVVAFVKDEQDVALAIKYARSQSLPIAVRGGGHSANAASSSEGGLIIDLSKHLNGVRIDVEKRLAYIGGGALWETVDRMAIAHGLATVGGTVNHTGVGGLTLGGGYGWLSPEHGLTIDNLVQATLVTADGSVLTASESENPDLYFGIRGGGGNFGVTTEFVLRLHPQRAKVYAGTLIYPPPALEQVLSVIENWYPKASNKESILQMTAVGPQGAIVGVMLFYNGTEAEGRENFKAFLDIGPVADTTCELPYEEVNSLQNPMVTHGSGQYQKGSAFKGPDFASMDKAFKKAMERSSTGLKINILYDYHPAAAKILSVPHDATPFRRTSLLNVNIPITWDNTVADRTEEAKSVANEISDIIAAGQPGLSNVELMGYTNYDPEHINDGTTIAQEKAKLIFGDHYAKLQMIKKKYDPENIFNKWFPIIPAA